jgi:crotonobetainyl-CoA:carnitine CoA-transferase CaiB-like acyl-CoA transferase
MPSDNEGESGAARYQFYATKDDRFVLFCAIEPKFWRNFCRAVERPDLQNSISESSPVDFGVGELALRRELQSIFRERTLADWLDLAVRYDLPLGPANRLTDLLDDPQLAARGVLVEGEHPRAGAFTYVGEAVRVADQPYEIRHPAPLLGEHTDEVLESIGLDAARREELRERGVI